MIAERCGGLMYISETDAPVALYADARAATVTAGTILAQVNLPPDTPVEEMAPATFFARLTKIEPWQDGAQRENAKKFLELQRLLEENLRELKVFKVGRVRIDIYVVGLDADNDLVGIKTRSVET